MNDFAEIIKYFRDECPEHNRISLTTKIDLNKVICEAFGISVEYLFIRSRKQEIINARRLYMYILNKKMKWGPSLTGRHIGWDHASVIHASKKCEALMSTERYYRDKVNQVLTELNHERINIPTYKSTL
jgi:chromosomal replication initiation ATPase DnaA